MTTTERKQYFGTLWPAACLANEWDVKDDARRRAVTLRCMELVRAPLTDSTSALTRDQVTALFTYLEHLADPASFENSAEWVRCQEDYKTYNRARQTDWHERKLYGTKKNRLDRNRFRGATSASGGPLETLDKDEVRKRHLTMASRHQKKQAKERGFKIASTPYPAGETRPFHNLVTSADGGQRQLNQGGPHEITTHKAGGTTVDVERAAGHARGENPF